MIVLVSLIVLLRGLPCFHDISHGASHPYIPIHSIDCTTSKSEPLMPSHENWDQLVKDILRSKQINLSVQAHT